MMKKLGNVFILGDSYSTFEGWIPEGYATYYAPTGNAGAHQPTTVDKTWWKLLLDHTDSTLLENNSWSGSPVCHIGYGEDRSGWSFVTRINEKLEDGTYGGKRVDTVLIFGGTNDFWGNNLLGEEKYENQTREDLFTFLPAFCYMLGFFKARFPDVAVRVIFNDEINGEYREKMLAVCRHYGMPAVLLQGIDKECGHPTEKGMQSIFEQVLASF